MFASDLKQDTARVKPATPVQVRVHKHCTDIEIADVSASEVRASKGDMVIVAYRKKDPVAYIFVATSNTWVGEIDDWLYIGPREVYLYDAYTMPDHRGSGIYPFLLCTARDYFCQRSFEHAIICSTARNQASIKGIERSGFHCYQVVTYLNILGWRSWRYEVGERHVRARLRNES
jgi:GNAT superfamily N-acetyltransferase